MRTAHSHTAMRTAHGHTVGTAHGHTVGTADSHNAMGTTNRHTHWRHIRGRGEPVCVKWNGASRLETQGNHQKGELP